MNTLTVLLVLVHLQLIRSSCNYQDVAQTASPSTEAPGCSTSGANWESTPEGSYFVQTNPACWLSWSEAEALCQDIDADLTTIDSWEESKSLGPYVGSWAVWINSSVDASDEYRKDGQCLQMVIPPRMSGVDYYWVDCESKAEFVCERPAAINNGTISNDVTAEPVFKQ